MIAKNYKDGELFSYNISEKEILLIDRSETTLTEVSTYILGSRSCGEERYHDKRELILYVVSGEATIKIDGKAELLIKNDMFYIPANSLFQFVNETDEFFEVLIFSVFLSDDKEGFFTFYEYFKNRMGLKVGFVAGQNEYIPKLARDYNKFKRYDFGSNDTYLMIDRSEAASSETTVVSWPPKAKGAMVSHSEKEQTFFVIKGTGWVTVDFETKQVRPGDVVRIPFKAPHTTEAGENELTYFCMNTIVTEETERTFDEMYNRVIEGRLKRWRSGDSSVGS